MSVAYFSAKHEALKHDYRDSTGNYVDSCALIAVEIAQLLQTEGKQPRILSIRGEKQDSAGNRAALVPTPYEGRVVWGGHVVCEAEGLIYDPMMDSVLPLDDYARAAFNQPIECGDHSRVLDRF